MLKFIKHNLETIAGIEVFPIISFLIFFLFFLVLFIWVFKISKRDIETLSNLPLEDNKAIDSELTTEIKNL